jgi:hypothetical protein
MAQEDDPAEPPADLVALYRELMLHRQEDWMRELTGGWGDASRGIGRAARGIREHPYWRTLPDPAAVSAAARELRALGVHDPEGGPPIRPRKPADLEEEQDFGFGPEDPRVRRELVRELGAAGLWDGLDLTDAELRAEQLFVEQDGHVLRFGLFHLDRRFIADAERMSGQGAPGLLDEMAPGLAAVGLALDAAVEQEAEPFRYESLFRPLIVINELLEAAGIDDRLYVDTSGNTVYLLPQKVHAVLIKDVYQAYDEKTLMLADRATWDRL